MIQSRLLFPIKAVPTFIATVALVASLGCGNQTTPPLGPPLATFSTQQVDFGQVVTGTVSQAYKVVLGNTGGQPLAILSSTLSDAVDFTMSTTCGPTLAPAANCTYTVQFTPHAATNDTALLTIADNSAGKVTAQQGVQLSGAGLPVPAAQAILTPSAVDFGAAEVNGTPLSRQVVLSNVGASVLTLADFSVSGAFSLGQNSCGASLQPNTSCSVTVVFQPQAAGSAAGLLTLLDNSGDDPAAHQSVTLVGTGTEPLAALAPQSLSFAKTAVNATSASQTVTLTNAGTAPLAVANVSVSGPAAMDYKVIASTCVGLLPVQSSCIVSISYAPSVDSFSDSAELVFDDDASGRSGSTQAVTLSGFTVAKVDFVENFGDSITCGYGAQVPQGYAGLFDTYVGAPAQNWCRIGDTAADLSRVWVPSHSNPVRNGNQLYTLMIGANDADRYGSEPGAVSTYLQELGAAVSWLAIPDSDKVLASAVVQKTGNWVSDAEFGLMSTTSGASLTFTVNQPSNANLYVVYHVWSQPQDQAGTANIAVDGVDVASVDESQGAMAQLPTGNGTTDTFFLRVVPLGSTGAHQVTFHSTGIDGSKVGLLWAGVPQQDYKVAVGSPRLLLGLITNSPSAAQTAAAGVYNEQIEALVPTLNSDGLNVVIVPTANVLDIKSDFTDYVHPNQSGYEKLATAFESYR